MSITPDFLDELRQRIPASDVVGKRVKLIRRGREHLGLCPFHKERTPSFSVNDEKGFYHCFGCGAHGDVVRFVMETEGLAFPDAVEKLAHLAGMTPPPRSARDKEEEEKRASLHEILEMAAAWFQAQLAAEAGREARAYLAKRGLRPETIAEFRIGYSPDRRTVLKDALIARKVSEADLIEAGLLIKPEDGGETFDRFRGRVMFPIGDPKGRIVAFGGRALGEAAAKYLNSPETPLFHKGRLLYNLARARGAARDENAVIVVEGYMDAISLAEAGIANAVAPLGTALTEDQLRLLWRLAPEPTLCFDGDDAGLRAAQRALDRALPLLEPGASLRFAFLPKGDDPDSLVRRLGAPAMKDVLARAIPLVDALWEAEFKDAPAGTPERRAGLEKKILELCRAIRDDKVRGHYVSELKDRLWRRLKAARAPAGFAPRAPGGRYRDLKGGRLAPPAPASRELVRKTAAVDGAERREQLLVLAVINHPRILERHAEEFATIEFTSAALDNIRKEILGIAARFSSLDPSLDGSLDRSLDSGEVRRHFQQRGRESEIAWLEEQLAGFGAWYVSPEAALGDALTGWTQEMKRHRRLKSLSAELERVATALAEEWTDGAHERFLAVKAEMDAADGDEAIVEGYGVASGRGPAL